jgi:hypothetical protein
MYYCILCKKLHKENQSKNEIIFKDGFHFVDAKRYNAGLCKAEPSKQVR